jgi:hypothetical protein
MLLTKSKFVAGEQCLKRLYLLVHEPELGAQPDESDQSIIEQGQQVGLLARQMFHGGVVVDAKNREEAVRATRELTIVSCKLDKGRRRKYLVVRSSLSSTI